MRAPRRRIAAAAGGRRRARHAAAPAATARRDRVGAVARGHGHRRGPARSLRRGRALPAPPPPGGRCGGRHRRAARPVAAAATARPWHAGRGARLKPLAARVAPGLAAGASAVRRVARARRRDSWRRQEARPRDAALLVPAQQRCCRAERSPRRVTAAGRRRWEGGRPRRPGHAHGAAVEPGAALQPARPARRAASPHLPRAAAAAASATGGGRRVPRGGRPPDARRGGRVWARGPLRRRGALPHHAARLGREQAVARRPGRPAPARRVHCAQQVRDGVVLRDRAGRG